MEFIFFEKIYFIKKKIANHQNILLPQQKRARSLLIFLMEDEGIEDLPHHSQ